MGRFQGVVWAVVVLGLVGCQAPIDPSKKVSEEELLSLAPELVSGRQSETTTEFFRELETLDSGDMWIAARAQPGDPLPKDIKFDIDGYLNEIERLTRPEWQTKGALAERVFIDHTYFLRSIAYAAVRIDPDRAHRAHLVNLKLAQRTVSASAGGHSVSGATVCFILSAQGVLDTLEDRSSLTSELSAYLLVIPKPGELIRYHLTATQVDWTSWYLPAISEREYPRESDKEVFAGCIDPFDRRKTAEVFVEAIRADRSAMERGQVPEFKSLRQLAGFRGDEDFSTDGEVLDPENTNPKMKAWARTVKTNAAGEALFRCTFQPLAESALRGEAVAAVLRGSFATMIMMNRGQRPESWEDVVEAGLLEEVPLDPYSKKPLEADFVKGRIRCQSIQISGKKRTNPLDEAVVQIPDWLLRIR
jgi:hypothetical protein